MAASSLMNIGVKALTASYAALQATGHNIANANVAGYSRQQVGLVTSTGQFTGSGFFGQGVDVQTVTRAHNQFLTGESARAASLAAMDGARLGQLRGLENVFKTGEMGLGQAVGSFLNSFGDLTSQPGDAATRQVVLARAADMAGRFSEAAGALDTLQSDVTSSLSSNVTMVNALARSVAQLNQKIAAVQSSGQPPNDLLDERDRLIKQIGEQVQVTRIDAADGTTGLFIAGGQLLVLGGQSATLVVQRDRTDPLRSALGVKSQNDVLLLDANSLAGGAIAGLLRFQNAELVDARALVGRLAASVGTAVNQQQQRGLNLLGSNPTPALFSLTAPKAVANASNATDANGSLLGQVSLAYTGDASALRASDYDLREDAANPGQWKITRLISGQLSQDPADSLSFSGSSANFQGVQVSFSATPQPGDRYLLKTVSEAANSMRVLLTDPRDLAAASPLTASTGTANTGTAAVTEAVVLANPLPYPGATARITFVDNSAADPANPVAYTFELLDATGSVLLSDSTPRTWRAGQGIPDSAVDINGFGLTLSGVPKPGDTISVAPTLASALNSNNGNARALLAVRDAALVDGQTLGEGYAQAMADIGSRVQTARSASGISAAVSAQADSARGADAGVNLDEEAARLIQYQQTYQAAAKMLQVAQALFDTLLQTTGR